MALKKPETTTTTVLVDQCLAFGIKTNCTQNSKHNIQQQLINFQISKIEKALLLQYRTLQQPSMINMIRKNPFRPSASKTKRKEIWLYFVIAIQTVVILFFLHNTNSISIDNNGSLLNKYNYNVRSFYDPPEIHTVESQLSRVWHSNGSPSINPDLKSGTCWCSGDDYCSCTPSLAIDAILTSGDNHIWLVKRKDVGKYAVMGGFVETGETCEEALRRELKEEMNLEILSDDDITFFGVYDDPMRDARRHTVSAVYVVNLFEGVVPKAGDDAASVVKVPFEDIGRMNFFADHKNILFDYMNIMRMKQKGASLGWKVPSIRRSMCSA